MDFNAQDSPPVCVEDICLVEEAHVAALVAGLHPVQRHGAAPRPRRGDRDVILSRADTPDKISFIETQRRIKMIIRGAGNCCGQSCDQNVVFKLNR